MNRRLFIGLLAATILAVVSLGSLLSDSLAWTNDYAHQKSDEKIPDPVIDGSKNPEMISDLIAQEILLRQLSTGDESEDKDWKIRDSYLKWSDYDEVQIAALKFAAVDFKKRIATLDLQATKIKEEKWPLPDKATMDQLSTLQRQKEDLIREISDNLFRQLTHHNPGALRTNLVGRIKFNTKGFAPTLPGEAPKRIGWIEKLFRDPFVKTAYAQYGGGAPSCTGIQYITSSTWVDYNADAVFTCAVVTANYNSCGHGYTLATTLTNNGQSLQGYNYVSLSLDPGGSSPRRDGFFGSTTTSYSYCTHLGTTHATGGSGSSANAAPTVSLVGFVATPNDTAANSTVELIANVKCSESISQGMVNVVFDKTGYNPGAVMINGLPSNNSGSFAGGEARILKAVNASGGRKGPVKFEVGIQSVPANTIVIGGKLEAEVCFGPKDGGSCPISVP